MKSKHIAGIEWIPAKWGSVNGFVDATMWDEPYWSPRKQRHFVSFMVDEVIKIPEGIVTVVGAGLAGEDEAFPGDILHVPHDEIMLLEDD